MKLTYLLLWAAVCVLPAGAAPITYGMTLTGSFFMESPPSEVPLDGSGAFTYETGTGFSNFIVNVAGGTFDLTASANGMAGCAPNSFCIPGATAADNFNDLLHDNSWSMVSFSPPISPDPSGDTALLFAQTTNGIFGEVPGTLIPLLTPHAGGTFSLTVTPEPEPFQTLLLAAFGLLSLRMLRLRTNKALSRRLD